MKRKLADYQQEYEEIAHLRDMEEEVVKLKDHLAWAYVIEQEKVACPIGNVR